MSGFLSTVVERRTEQKNTVANSAQARKRARQAEASRQRNMSQRSMMRTYMKRVVNAIESGDKEAAQAAYVSAVPVIDQMANRGLIHRNKAARHKSRMNAKIRAL
jgi:small subunit ribosomal protein S20